ncbi:efflux transporter outer membrane subunit [Sphingomonas sp.]|uniref:efflux transporter outer membrane subunit n=1 Tax=Sphingomonas sp. TaxID=28214 RepID=UPI0035C85188
MQRAVLLAATVLAGCTVGPDYKGPPAVASDVTARGVFVRAADPALSPAPGLARWWEELSDAQLTALIEQALENSPTIDQATAKIREARALLSQQRANRYPSISTSLSYINARLPGDSLSGAGTGDGDSTEGDPDAAGAAQPSALSIDNYNLGLTASWEPDLFGGKRRAVEQAKATIAARFADLADAQVSLTAKVAQAYVNLRDVQARIRLNDGSAALQQRQVTLTRQRYAGGTASLIDVERFQNRLETTRADAIPLGAQRDQYLDELAVYTGSTPGTLDARLNAVAPVPLPPASVTIGNPAALIARRPDVRSAERMLAANTAAIGLNKAKELPGVRLLGLLGLGGSDPADIVDLGKLTTLAAPTLSYNLLDFGAARARTRQSEAQRDAANAQYRQTVLEALQDAEDALSRFGNTRAQLGQLGRAEASAVRAARLNEQRVAAGTSAVTDQLDIERQKLSAAIAVVRAKAQLTLAYIAVNKALGLGWSDPAESPVGR